jgi:hypothetical protein
MLLLLASFLVVRPAPTQADVDDCAEVGRLAEVTQDVTGENVTVAFVD